MKLIIDSDVCKKYNTSMEELLFLILSSNKCNIPTIKARIPPIYGVENKFNDWQFYLTDKGEELINNIIVESEPIVQKQGNRFENLAKQLREIFPAGKKDQHNYWRDSVKVITTRLQKFVKIYGDEFTDEQIINATKRYVESFNGNYQFMKLLKYFIMKTEDKNGEKIEESQLLNYLENDDEDVVYNNDWNIELR